MTRVRNNLWLLCLCFGCLLSSSHANAENVQTAEQLIRSAIELWRGDNSYSQVSMTIHRPDWQQTLTLEGWTRGEHDSLIRFTEPAKDRGNATLKRGRDIWIFTPKLNKVIRLPSSLVAQSWMGSDLTYQDLTKGDELLNHYDAEISEILSDAQARKLYQITLTPKPNAPVVWGQERLLIRDDGLLMSETFFDQTLQPVKRLEMTQEGRWQNRPFPQTMRMLKLNQPGHWTEIHTFGLWMNIQIPDAIFSITQLKSPLRWQPPSHSELTTTTAPNR